MCPKRKGRSKTLSLFAHEMILFIKNPKESTKNTWLEPIKSIELYTSVINCTKMKLRKQSHL